MCKKYSNILLKWKCMAKNMSENLSEIKKYIFKLYSSIKKVEVFFCLTDIQKFV